MSGQAERSAALSFAAQEPLAGLPCGVVALAKELLEGHDVPVEPEGASSTAIGVTDEQLAALLYAPKQLDRGWPRPVEPVPVGDGWLHAELIDDDRPLFEALVEQHGPSGPDAVAARCQEARLPVCPYRSPQTLPAVASPAEGNDGDDGDDGDDPTTKLRPLGQEAISGSVIVDLTTHWAGPLATKLLADAGATVIKIDPSCRPDGFGDRPLVYKHLNGNKEILDLDLRSPEDRAQFETLVRRADLLVESFSRRVMANLGYRPAELRALHPTLATVSIKAFPAQRPEADWLAYGPGVHAAEGLASFGPPMPGGLPPQPLPTPIAYPDFLTGIAAYVASVELLSAQDAGGKPDVEVAMAEVIAPLRAAATPWPTDAGSDRGADE
jgi:hypothetical protein